MKCDEFKNIAFELAAGELEGGQAEEARRHMEECPDCRGEYESCLKIIEALNAAGEVEAPKDFAENVMKSLPAAKPRLNSMIIRFGTAAAAAVLLAAGTVALYPVLREGGDPVVNVTEKDAGKEKSSDGDPSAISYATEAADGGGTDGEAAATAAAQPTSDTAATAASADARGQNAISDANAENTKKTQNTAPAGGELEADARSKVDVRSDADARHEDKAAENETAETSLSLDGEPSDTDKAAGSDNVSSDDGGSGDASSDDVSPVSGGGVAPITVGPGQEITGVTPRSVGAGSSAGVIMGADAIDTPDVADGTVTDGTVAAGRGGGGGGRSSANFVATTVTFAVNADYAEAVSAVSTEGKSREELEAELGALGIPFKVDVIPVDYSSEYYSAESARRAEIEKLCSEERCEIILLEE